MKYCMRACACLQLLQLRDIGTKVMSCVWLMMQSRRAELYSPLLSLLVRESKFRYLKENNNKRLHDYNDSISRMHQLEEEEKHVCHNSSSILWKR